MFYRLFAILLGYCLAAMCSANVAMVVSATVWTSVWTWAVLLFWVFVAHLVLIPVLIAAIFGVGAVGFGSLIGVAAIIDWWNNRRK